MPDPLPDCAWCSAANTLEVVYEEMGVRYCRCSCCSKQCLVTHHGHVYRSDLPDLRDVSGSVMYEP